MNSTLILFKEIGRQLLIVGLVLGSLPMAICRSVATLWQRNSSGRAGQPHTEQSVF